MSSRWQANQPRFRAWGFHNVPGRVAFTRSRQICRWFSHGGDVVLGRAGAVLAVGGLAPEVMCAGIELAGVVM